MYRPTGLVPGKANEFSMSNNRWVEERERRDRVDLEAWLIEEVGFELQDLVAQRFFVFGRFLEGARKEEV